MFRSAILYSIFFLSFSSIVFAQGEKIPDTTTDMSAGFERLDDLDRILNNAKLKANQSSSKFASLFNKAQKAVLNNDIKKAEELKVKLNALDGLSDYEKSHLHLLDYWIYGKQGNKELEFESAAKLLDTGAGQVQSDAFVEAGMRLLKRQYNNQDIGGSIQTLNNLRKDSGSQEELMSIVSVVKKLDDFSEQQTDIVQKITVNENGVWSAKLMKPQFFFNAINGEVNTLGFNCTNKQTTLNYKPDSVMEIPEAWGSCTMKVNAKPNTTFNFVQSQKKAA